MSLFMAVRSPALITYSLTLTILNRIWVRRKFESLFRQLDGLPSPSSKLRKRLKAAQYLLQESQQVPMRASQVNGWLSSLIVLEDSHPWWMRVKKDLQNSRRGYTFSLFAQIGMAFIAYTFTIASSLNSEVFGNDEGSQVLLTAGGGIWIWMIPVIGGWIMCGTQARARSILEALDDKTHLASRVDENGNLVKNEMQRGICSRSGLIPRPGLLELASTAQPTVRDTGSTAVDRIDGAQETHLLPGRAFAHGITPAYARDAAERSDASSVTEQQKDENVNIMVAPRRSPLGRFSEEAYEKLEYHRWLEFSLEGDEAREGPLFNYARLFTFREFSSTIAKAFVAKVGSLGADNRQQGNLFETAESYKLEKLLQAYTPWHQVDSIVWHHMLIAVGVAIFVQWGTVGPAIMMGYLTPTVGLGCRSGGYTLYGVAATISWALLIWSSLLSHSINLRYQDIYMGRQKFVPRKEERDPEDADEAIEMMPKVDPDLSAHSRTLGHSILACLTVTTRVAGKLIAAANACWIVVSAIFEYTGVYSSCWCETDADVFGYRGWAVVFATSQSFFEASKSYWVGGVIFSFGVCFLAYVGFFLGCKRSDVNEYDD